jgi:hypothetical protein
MNTPTEAHYQLAHDILQSSYQEESAQLIASSEARACDQLRSDLERADTLYQRACEVEHELRAELTVERARLDYLLKWEVTFHGREDIDRDMKEGTK